MNLGHVTYWASMCCWKKSIFISFWKLRNLMDLPMINCARWLRTRASRLDLFHLKAHLNFIWGNLINGIKIETFFLFRIGWYTGRALDLIYSGLKWVRISVFDGVFSKARPLALNLGILLALVRKWLLLFRRWFIHLLVELFKMYLILLNLSNSGAFKPNINLNQRKI